VVIRSNTVLQKTRKHKRWPGLSLVNLFLYFLLPGDKSDTIVHKRDYKPTKNIPLDQVGSDDKNSQDSAITVTKPEVNDEKSSIKTPVETLGLTIDRPVRSGQQVYAKNGDLIVLSQTSAGSEVMADGSIHVYGPLRGRVLAGVKGDKTARIFCRSLEAELIVIAGCYQLLDESKTDLKGKPAMIRLEDEKLIIESLD